MARQIPSDMKRARERARALWKSGLPVAQVQETLILEGVDPQVAQAIGHDFMAEIGRVFKEAGRKQMLYGAVWVALALVVTGITFLGAVGTDKPFLFAWGLAALGGIQTLRGLYQYGKGRATVAQNAAKAPGASDDHAERRPGHG